MLKIQPYRQPDRIHCLPACVWSVLRFMGEEVPYDVVVEACALGPLGAIDEIAMQGLREAGWDVDVLGSPDRESIEAALAEERPVILTLPVGKQGSDFFLHAVVVCDADGEGLTIMDPQVGDYKSLPARALLLRSGHGLVGPLLIGAATR